MYHDESERKTFIEAWMTPIPCKTRGSRSDEISVKVYCYAFPQAQALYGTIYHNGLLLY